MKTTQLMTHENNDAMAQALELCPDLVMGKRDPFSQATPANHIRAAWLAEQIDRHWGDGEIHLRGLHYLLLSAQAVIPKTSPRWPERAYQSTSFEWLKDTLKCARWLGYVPWVQIVDERNARPTMVTRPAPQSPRGRLVATPDPDDIWVPQVTAPRPTITGLAGEQPNRIVLAGEKTSLRPVLGAISEEYGTDLFLCAGDLSDTRIHELAEAADTDGRHTVILFFADSDPQGWNMSIVLARKLAAMQGVLYPGLEYEIHRAALTPDQVRQLGLPESDLKGTIAQADTWRERHGVEQTEIDALAALQPDTLERLALEALGHFYDLTLVERAEQAEARWSAAVQEHIVRDLDTGIITEANANLVRLRRAIGRVYDDVESAVNEIELPQLPEVVQPRLPDSTLVALCDSRWGFEEQTRRLIADKQYEDPRSDDDD